jgi:acetate kinase
VDLLVVNAGSSSVKISVLGAGPEPLFAREVEAPDPETVRAALGDALRTGPPVDAAGHRVVHGGSEFLRAVRVDAGVEDRLDALSDLAPLHNAPSTAAIRTLQSLAPGLTQVACFDTSFHADMPPEATTYAVPASWSERWGVRRYGFHGLSHAWASRRAARLLGRPVEELRLITAHIGAGASLAAVAGGRSVDTTMGFTPLDGLVMATRSGSVDPGLLTWVQRHGGLSATDVEDDLERRSGLLGLSGTSGDLRRVLEAADGGDERAAIAYRVYLHRLRGAIAAMAAAMGGVDGLVFTGGAGEHSVRLRHDTCAGLAFLGLRLDPDGEEPTGDAVVSAIDATTAVVVVQAREDLEIARQVRALLRAPASHDGGR